MWQTLLCLVVNCSPPDTNLLSGQVVRVTSILNPPYLSLKDGEGLEGNDRYEGIVMDIIERMENILGAHFHVELVKDGRYGVRHENGTWNGMIGEVMRGEADIAMADITVTPVRSLAMDWTMPIMESGIVGVAKVDDDEEFPEHISDYVEDDAKFSMFCCGSTNQFFKQSQDKLAQDVLAKTDAEGLVKSTTEGIERVKAGEPGEVVFMMESGAAQYIVKNDCSLKMVGKPFGNAKYAIGLAKGAAMKDEWGQVVEYRSLLNYALLKIHSTGEMAKIMESWYEASC